MEATDRVFAEIMCEHTTEVAQLEAALYVADAVIESQIFDGQLTEEEAMAVAEGSIKDFVAGIRSKLAKLWEKVKGWFVSLKNNMKVYLTNGTKFFKQYENEIKSKAKNNKLEVIYQPQRPCDPCGSRERTAAWAESLLNLFNKSRDLSPKDAA